MPALDSDYETQFFSVAYPLIRDQAPSLQKHGLGFQMIDKSDDDGRAVGVFVFKAGDEIIQCPIFFLNGEIKGEELMLLSNRDQFVPLTEDWINYVLNRKPQVLGEAEKTPREQLNLRSPDMSVYSRAPMLGSKIASAGPTFQEIRDKVADRDPQMAEAVTGFLNTLPVGPRDERYKGLDDGMDLRNALRVLPKQASVTLLNTMAKDAAFAEAILKFYNPADLLEAAQSHDKTAAVHDERLTVGFDKPDSFRKAPPDKKVRVIRLNRPIEPLDGLSDRQKEKLIAHGYVVKDDREGGAKSKLLPIRVELNFKSPEKGGEYEVLTADGGTRRMLILFPSYRVGYDYFRQTYKTVLIDREAGLYGNYQPSDVLTDGFVRPMSVELPGLVSATELRDNDLAFLVGPGGHSTNVFSVHGRMSRTDGSVEFRVCADSAPSPDSWLPHFQRPERHYDAREDPNSLVQSIVLTGRPGDTATHIGRALFVPDTWKAFKIGKFDAAAPEKSGPVSLSLGSLNDLAFHTVKVSQEGWIRPLKLQPHGPGWDLVWEGQEHVRLDKAAALGVLLEKAGLDEEEAEEALAAAKSDSAEFWVKPAFNIDPLPADFTDTMPGYDAGSRYPTRYPYQRKQYLGQNDNQAAAEAYRIDPYIDEAAKQFAGRAAQQGQKEVVDTAVVSALVKSVNPIGEVKRMIPDMQRALDRLGRTLLLYYWHNEEFARVYGKQDLAEMEDNTRDVFKGLGKLVIHYRRKNVLPDQEHGSEPTLSEQAA